MSDPQRPPGLQPSRLLHPWDFPGKSTGVGCHTFIIFKKVKPHTRCYWYCLWGFKFTHVFTILSLFISSLTVSLPSGIAFFLHAVHPLEFPFEWFPWKQVFLVLGFFNFILILEIYFLWVQNSRLVGFFFFSSAPWRSDSGFLLFLLKNSTFCCSLKVTYILPSGKCTLFRFLFVVHVLKFHCDVPRCTFIFSLPRICENCWICVFSSFFVCVIPLNRVYFIKILNHCVVHPKTNTGM